MDVTANISLGGNISPRLKGPVPANLVVPVAAAFAPLPVPIPPEASSLCLVLKKDVRPGAWVWLRVPGDCMVDCKTLISNGLTAHLYDSILYYSTLNPHRGAAG